MRKNTVFEHFIPYKLRRSLAPQEPKNRKILRLFAVKFYKSDGLLETISKDSIFFIHVTPNYA